MECLDRWYLRQGLGHESLVVYGQMKQERLIVADPLTFACLLKACASTGALQKGRQLHSQIVERGLLDRVVACNRLVDVCTKCGELEDAHKVFDSLASKDVVTWNGMIAGYAQQGRGHEALEVYGQMEEAGIFLATHVTFACLLKVCASTSALQKGRDSQTGLLDDVKVGTCLVDMYAKCGELEDARQSFDRLKTKNVVTWNALIAGYVQQGLGDEALVVYGQMGQEGLILATDATFVSLLNACASTGALLKGRELHSKIVERGLLADIVEGNCLVDMYAKCGEVKDARQVFDCMVTKDVVTWNALMYGACDEDHKAIACFEKMLIAGAQPNGAQGGCALHTCSNWDLNGCH